MPSTIEPARLGSPGGALWLLSATWTKLRTSGLRADFGHATTSSVGARSANGTAISPAGSG